MSLDTDDLEDEDSFGGEISEDEFTLIIHGFRTDFKNHPLDFSHILDSLENTLKCLGFHSEPWSGVEMTCEHAEARAQKRMDSGIDCDLREELVLSPTSVFDKTSPLSMCCRSDRANPLSPGEETGPSTPIRKCMCSACLGNMHHSRWALVSNKASPVKISPVKSSLGKNSPNLVKVCSECARLKDGVCSMHQNSDLSGKNPNKTDLSCGSFNQNSVSRNLTVTMQTSAAIEAGIFINSPISATPSFEKLDNSSLPHSRCYLRSVSSSGYGSDIHRLSSCTSDRESVFSLSTHMDSESHCPQENLLSPLRSMEENSTTETTKGSHSGQFIGSSNEGAQGKNGSDNTQGSQANEASCESHLAKRTDCNLQNEAKQCNECEANSFILTKSRDKSNSANANEDDVSASALYSQSEVLTSGKVTAVTTPSVPSKSSVGGLDSGLGLDSDPGYDEDMDAESGISEDMGSDDESHLDDLDPGLLAAHTGTGPTHHRGKKSACVGSKVFLVLPVCQAPGFQILTKQDSSWSPVAITCVHFSLEKCFWSNL